MDSLIKCPHCNEQFEINEALRQHIQEQVLTEERSKHKKEIAFVKKDAEERIEKQLREELELDLKKRDEENEAMKKRLDRLIEDLGKERELSRALKHKDEERELEFQKKLVQQEAIAREELSKKIAEKFDWERREMQKQLDDTKTKLEDALRKAEQKSQQLQGEVQELELEQLLSSTFPDDTISPVGKGITGADICLVVKTKKGNICGEILIESKRTKAWSEEWVEKLKTDVRAQKATVGIIVSTVLPKGMLSDFGYWNGVYVSTYPLLLPLLEVIRKKLIEVAYQKFITVHKGEKAEMLYEYVTGHEFRQQIEAFAEVYKDQLVQITTERAALERIWKKREEQARKILVSTTTIFGAMQGIVGGSMPQIQSLDLIDDGQ